ncbi:hypothetical protein ACSBR1_009630 [Camellia fascicularis]
MGTKWIFFQDIQLILNTEDAYRNSKNPHLIPSYQSTKFLKLKVLAYWEMKNHCHRLRFHVWSGALNTILNTLKHVHPMLILTDVGLLV